MQNKQSDINLIYEGSVKKVWQPEAEKDRLWFEYTDDYSVFDWGKMPDTIGQKGRALAIIGAHFFEKLADAEFWQSLPKAKELSRFRADWLESRWHHLTFANVLSRHGCQSHYKGLVSKAGKQISIADAAESDEQVYLSVLPVKVNRPEAFSILGQNVYHYPPIKDSAERRLVPLEVIFRFGMPAGSSLKKRLERNPDYARVLGLETIPAENEWFDRPVVELYTKLEDKDRLLSVQEALLISGLTPGQLEEMIEMSYGLALALFVLFAQSGIELWDGKFEFAIDKNGLMLVDSIGPDELRLIHKKVHLSKEMIRQVYRGSTWESAIAEAQKIASLEGRIDWKEICRTQLKQEPKTLPASFKAVIDKLYPVLANSIVGKQVFAKQPTLEEFVRSVDTACAGVV